MTVCLFFIPVILPIGLIFTLPALTTPLNILAAPDTLTAVSKYLPAPASHKMR